MADPNRLLSWKTSDRGFFYADGPNGRYMLYTGPPHYTGRSRAHYSATKAEHPQLRAFVVYDGPSRELALQAADRHAQANQPPVWVLGRSNPPPKGIPTVEEGMKVIRQKLSRLSRSADPLSQGLVTHHPIEQQVILTYLGPRKERLPEGHIRDYAHAFVGDFVKQGRKVYWYVYRDGGKLAIDTTRTPAGYWGPVPALELLSWESDAPARRNRRPRRAR
jgi:hypothetical protein